MPKLTDEMKQLIERQRLGFVATVCPDGTPNVSPKGTVCVLDDDHLIFLALLRRRREGLANQFPSGSGK